MTHFVCDRCGHHWTAEPPLADGDGGLVVETHGEPLCHECGGRVAYVWFGDGAAALAAARSLRIKSEAAVNGG